LRSLAIRMSIAILLCVSASIGGSAQTDAGTQKTKRKTKVETRYDEKRGETLATIGPFELWKPPQNSVNGEINYESIDLSVSFTYPGRKIVTPDSVTLLVFTNSEGGAQFEKNRRLSFSTNSGQYEPGEMEYLEKAEGRVARKALGGANLLLVREVLRKTIPLEDFSRIAEAEKADIKIGGRKIKLEKKHLEAFRNFVLLMRQEGLEF
jgi:hypothetical protein